MSPSHVCLDCNKEEHESNIQLNTLRLFKVKKVSQRPRRLSQTAELTFSLSLSLSLCLSLSLHSKRSNRARSARFVVLVTNSKRPRGRDGRREREGGRLQTKRNWRNLQTPSAASVEAAHVFEFGFVRTSGVKTRLRFIERSGSHAVNPCARSLSLCR